MIILAKSEKTIYALASLHEVLATAGILENCTLQNIDFTNANLNWRRATLKNTSFLGCTLTLEEEHILREKGAYIYPKQKGLPYNPYRETLYKWQDLMKGYDPLQDASTDLKIYEHFSKTRFNPNINEQNRFYPRGGKTKWRLLLVNR